MPWLRKNWLEKQRVCVDSSLKTEYQAQRGCPDHCEAAIKVNKHDSSRYQKGLFWYQTRIERVSNVYRTRIKSDHSGRSQRLYGNVPFCQADRADHSAATVSCLICLLLRPAHSSNNGRPHAFPQASGRCGDCSGRCGPRTVALIQGVLAHSVLSLTRVMTAIYGTLQEASLPLPPKYAASWLTPWLRALDMAGKTARVR